MSHPQRHLQQGSHNRSTGICRGSPDASTCTFWERGRCTRGEECRFNHYYSSGSANWERGVAGSRGNTTLRDSLRPPASIDEQCKYYRKRFGCSMGDRCAYRHSSYRTDEILRLRSYERQQQHTNLDANRCVSDEEEDDSSVSDVYLVIRESDSSSDYASESVEHRALSRNGLADRRRRNMSAGSMDSGNVVVPLRDEHRYTPSDSEEESDTEGELSPVSSEDEGVHFYGAPGGFRARDIDEEADWRFAVASAIRLEEHWSDDEAPTVHTQEKSCDSQSSCSQPPREVCRFFLNGNCTRGVQCLYAHPVETEELYKQQADDEPPPPDCGICLDNVTKFGILTGCDHAFCFKCLGKWRKVGGQIKLTAVRGCPVCRKPSFFIIPSATFVTGKKKHKLIEAYKDNLAKIPCRNFKYNDPDSCRFGCSCFFLHQGPQGQNVPRRARIRQDAEGITETFSSRVTIGDVIFSPPR